IDAVSGANRRLALAKRIPRERESWAEQPLRIVFGECRFPDPGVRQKDAIGIRDVIGGTAKLLIPSSREFVPEAHSECEIRTQLHRIFRVPCAEPTAET